MKRIVIPIYKESLSMHFRKCTHFEIYDIDSEVISKREVENKNASNSSKMTAWLENLGTTDIIAYNIDNESINNILTTKINLFVGITFKKPKVIIENYLNGSLKSNTKIIR